ncbi:MAG: AAA family ATPase [Patescibacteria group bacterium]
MFGGIFNQKKGKDDPSADSTAAAPVDQSQQPVAPPSAAPTASPSQAQTPVVSSSTSASDPTSPSATDPTVTSDPTIVPTTDPAAVTTPVSTSNVDTGTPVTSDVSALSHLDPRTSQVLTHAQEETKRIKQQFIEPDQLLIGLLYDQQIYQLLADFQQDGGALSKEVQAAEKMGTFKEQPVLSKTAQEVFDQAYRDAKMRGSNFISPEDLLIVLSSPTYTTGAYLQKKGLKKEAIVDKLSKNPKANYSHKTILEKYGLDLTEEARAGRLDPVAGREKEVDRIVHILLRRTKNNPIIIGETGVGKTAIVEGLAQMIVNGKIPKDLQDKRIFQLDVASLVAGASHRGEFEERLRGVINEVLGANNKIVLFIDEIHTLMGAGGDEGMSAANIIKPHLARGHFQLIGATTTTEYRKNFEKDKAFERRFQPVTAEEPSEENAVEMLKVIRPKYEKFHHVTIPDDALKECVKLSKKYIGERYLPDKAVDLLDEASSEVKLQMDGGKRGDNQIKKSDIEKVVSAWTGIPITKLTEDESEKLLKLEDRIHQRLIDQEEAVSAVSEAVRRGRIGLASGKRPIASFIFLGPTGVGKTELAKTLAELLFGRDDAMARLDMSEYMEKHEVAKLIGAPPGYVGYEEGGVLTEAVRKKPYSIVLMDEIEKAHPDVFNILLQLLEDGRLTDNKGNTISFKNTIVICTSNIGSSLIQQQLSAIDAQAKPTAEQLNKQFTDLQKIVKEELTKFLRPEVLNRFDEVVIFKPLRPEHMAGIVRLEIAKTAKLLKEEGYTLQITEKAVAQLAKDGYDPVYGARPLRRLIQTAIENPIALAIIGKKFVVGDTIVIDYSTDTNEFVFVKDTSSETAIVLTDEQFKEVLQKVAQPESITDAEEKMKFSALHDKCVQASTGGNGTATAILSVNSTSSTTEIQKIRKDLEDAKKKGDAFAIELLDLANSVAKQIQTATTFKKVLLQIINPATVTSPVEKEKFVALHERLLAEQQQQNQLAVSIMAVNDATPPQIIETLMHDLEQAKNQGSEFATDVLAAVNAMVADSAQSKTANPGSQYKKIFRQLSNPLYLASPENKAKFSQLNEKITEASKQNHQLAAAILAITDITSDADIQDVYNKLELAKKNGDPLAIEILTAVAEELKNADVNDLRQTLNLLINPIAAASEAERTQYTDLQAKISHEAENSNKLAAMVLAITEATTNEELTQLKQQLEQAKIQNDMVGLLILDAVAGTFGRTEAPAVAAPIAPASVNPAPFEQIAQQPAMVNPIIQIPTVVTVDSLAASGTVPQMPAMPEQPTTPVFQPPVATPFQQPQQAAPAVTPVDINGAALQPQQ